MSDPHANPLAGADLAAFVATVETASVGTAGEALSLTPSAVTKRIQSLERRVGTSLFDRGRFGMRPTTAGRLLYPEAKHALEALRQAEEAVAEHTTVAGRAIAIASSHTIGEYLLPGWLAAFRTHDPGVRAQVEIVNSPGVLRALSENEVQVGFVEGTDDLTGFDTIAVHDDRMVVVVAKGHPWCRRRAVKPAALAEQPYLTRETASGTRAVATAALAAAGVELVPSLEAGSTQAIKRALADGGFSILSGLAVEAELRARSLCSVAVEGLDLDRRLYAVRDGRHPPKGLAKTLWTWLQQWRKDQEPEPRSTTRDPG